jgi:thiamine pyrophosphate-dependent acetolactate synthase large subunit-like protein
MKVLEALAAAIAAEGVDHIFAVMGDANQDIIVELCEKHGLKYVHAHHETAAGGMADGYSRFTGKIGLCATTQGPGYTNATRSLVGARLHRSPVFLLAGHASLRDPYNPQGMVDQHAMALLSAGGDRENRSPQQCRLLPWGSVPPAQGPQRAVHPQHAAGRPARFPAG